MATEPYKSPYTVDERTPRSVPTAQVNNKTISKAHGRDSRRSARLRFPPLKPGFEIGSFTESLTSTTVVIQGLCFGQGRSCGKGNGRGWGGDPKESLVGSLSRRHLCRAPVRHRSHSPSPQRFRTRPEGRNGSWAFAFQGGRRSGTSRLQVYDRDIVGTGKVLSGMDGSKPLGVLQPMVSFVGLG